MIVPEIGLEYSSRIFYMDGACPRLWSCYRPKYASAFPSPVNTMLKSSAYICAGRSIRLYCMIIWLFINIPKKLLYTMIVPNSSMHPGTNRLYPLRPQVMAQPEGNQWLRPFSNAMEQQHGLMLPGACDRDNTIRGINNQERSLGRTRQASGPEDTGFICSTRPPKIETKPWAFTDDVHMALPGSLENPAAGRLIRLLTQAGGIDGTSKLAWYPRKRFWFFRVSHDS
ncbi:hypothetical protein HZ326_24300 [Fusarium oxysporum f. sp. albedinis]|nr:hypothetical protein HZ326_24300 [Fusarium oxysporum f. sp. albedinis]